MKTTPTARDRGAARNYPPLAVAGLVMLLILGVLPSSLNLPHENPPETLEYAPVPPEGSDSATPAGNFSSLGLGTSPGFAPAAEEGGPGVVGGGGGGLGGRAVKTPSTKRCVGNPPRQTEDLLSPPCVAFFTGNNHGATAPGVTRYEVRVLFYLEGNTYEGTSSRGIEETPSDTYVDLALPPDDPANETPSVRMLRLLQAYFNNRYQTYNRFVHFIVYYSGGGITPEQRRADAAKNLADVQPFLVLDYARANATAYMDAIAQKGIIVMLGSGPGVIGFGDRYFDRYPGLLWSYLPSLERRAAHVGSVVCRQLAGRPATFSGHAQHNGQTRILGLIMEQAEDVFPEKVAYGRLIQSAVESCGGFAITRAYNSIRCPSACSTQAMTEFMQQNVSTVVFAQGDLGDTTRSAGSIGYRPEWIVAGDGLNDETFVAQLQDQSVFSNAWAVSTYAKRGPLAADSCAQAMWEVDPEADPIDVGGFGCLYYDSTQLAFTGIQVAGPRLTAASMNQGFHAIPGHTSPDPRAPACFFPAGDYTCVKDAITEWWDPSGTDAGSGGSGGGCWRLVEGGRRYLVDKWARVELLSRKSTQEDVCNSQYAAA